MIRRFILVLLHTTLTPPVSATATKDHTKEICSVLFAAAVVVAAAVAADTVSITIITTSSIFSCLQFDLKESEKDTLDI